MQHSSLSIWWKWTVMSRWCDLSLLWFRYGRGAPYNLVIKPVTSQFYEIKKSSWSRIRQNSWRVFTSDIWTWCWLSETEPETRVAACPKWLKHRLLSGPYLTRLWEKKKEAVAVRAIELNHHISLVVSQKHHQLPWPELNSQPVAWTNDIFDLNTSFMLTMTTDSQGRREAGGGRRGGKMQKFLCPPTIKAQGPHIEQVTVWSDLDYVVKMNGSRRRMPDW